MINHHNAQKQWLEDYHAEEACKNLIISTVDKVYLEELWDKRLGYKGKSLRDFMDLLINNFPATPEKRATQKLLIDQPWDTNEEIVTLISRIKKQLTILAEMKDAIPYPEEYFVEALYMAVQKTKQFPKACSKWKKKPEWAHNTEAQAKGYFKNMYEIFDEQRDSLHDIGVTNNVVMQEKLDSLAADNTLMRQKMVADRTRAKQYHEVIEQAMSMTQTTESERDDTTLQTQLSAFTASQAQNTDIQFTKLRCQLEQCMSIRGGTPPPAVIDTATNNGAKNSKGRSVMDQKG